MVGVRAGKPSRYFYGGRGGGYVVGREEKMWGTRLAEIGYGWDDLGVPARRGRRGVL